VNVGLQRGSGVDIVYGDREVQRLCEDERKMKKGLGAAGARKLKTRLADLCAAERVGELAAGSPHPLHGDRRGQFAVGLDGGRRLVFEPADSTPPQTDDGSIDWPRVTRIRIVFIGDYHD
jgi:proteic killer suppression protein